MRIIGLSEFVALACKSYPNEAAGFLFAKNIYSPQEVWMIQPVKNISETPTDSWFPDKKEMLTVKRIATNHGFIKIGNIHSHPHHGEIFSIEEQVKPSEKDLMFARKFNDLVRIIILVKSDAILSSITHDKFGNVIPVVLHDNQCVTGDV